ncbi:hypothetical protein [Parapedobacter tibetensis]|uniref:hypothetical protein n=1 Tax=Parapedobacter tibetensis TaxID=2972951 RepID=UPI00214DAF36|nr:hypothetical protein [Parapedobacter tibetensis]
MNTNTLYGILLKLYNTFKLNGFYILLALLVPIILWKVQVGRDIIASLAENGEQHYINIPLLVASFSMLAISNWVIPVLAIDIWRFILKRRVKSQWLYLGLIGLYNGKDVSNINQQQTHPINNNRQFPIRYFASLPWVVFLYVTTYSFFPNHPLVPIVTIIVLCAFIMVIDKIYRKRRVPPLFQHLWDNATRWGNSDRKRALHYVASIGLLFGLFLVIIGGLGFWLRDSVKGLMWLVISSNFIAILIIYAYMKFSENVDARSAGTSYFVSKYIHILSLTLTLTAAVLLQCCNGIRWPIEISFFSPVFILIIVISLYLFLADVLITTQLNITWIYNSRPEKYDLVNGEKPGKPVSVWYRPIVRFVAIGFIFLFFFNTINSHRIRKEMAQPEREYTAALRPKLVDYFDNWIAHRSATPGDTLKVYLISGQGGGSRAAVWFFMAMNYLDSLESTGSYRFADHVFSISTVSGSTSGAAMYLADRYLDVPSQATSVVPRLKTIYAKNYLSSSFWGALIGDGFEGIKHEVFDRLAGIQRAFPKDRNYYFQQEEVMGYSDATPIRQADEISGFFEKDYLTPYITSLANGQSGLTANDVEFNYTLPLLFINSAVVDRGERGVFSPVDLGSFSLGTDLYGLFKKHNRQYNIPLITCVNQSQAFPIINAYNYLDGVGRLIDGGIYENSGTTTTLEIYETLKNHWNTKHDAPYHVRFVCINIVNTNMDAEKSEVRFRPASVLNTLTAAFQSPFGGHESFSYRNILRKVTAPDTAYSIQLIRPVPLTRMLQAAAVDTMYVALRETGID